jgi:hypothetical protein
VVKKPKPQRWTLATLAAFVEARLNENLPELSTDATAVEEWLASDALEIASARRGDIGPLRARYPHLAEFLHLPTKGRRGKYLRKPKSVPPGVSAARAAAEDVPAVGGILIELFGAVARAPHSPIEIVAEMWGIKRDKNDTGYAKIETARKKLNKKKGRPAPKN